MFALSVDIVRLFGACLAALLAANLIANLVLTYLGYDPKVYSKGWVLRKRWAIGLTLVFWFLFFTANIYVAQCIDYNPPPISISELVGTWHKRGAQFTLNSDGTFTRDSKVGTSSCVLYWTLDETNNCLHVTDKSGNLAERWRVITIRGDYRLIEDFPLSLHPTSLRSGFRRIDSLD